MARAFITGIEGFTGRYLADELRSAGHVVTGISMEGAAGSYRCDLNELDTVKQVIQDANPDWVFHLAAIAFVAHGDAGAMYRTNIVGTRNLLEALAANRKPAGILLASSANIYGNATAGVLAEDAKPAPANDYAVSKLAMEMMSALWMARLPITIVRPFNYSGVGQSINFLLPKIVDCFRRREPVLVLGNLDVTRDFSDVRRVVSVYRRLLESSAAGQTLNVCSGKGYSLMEVVSTMKELTGHAPDIQVNPAFVRENEVRTLIGSNRALEKIIGPVESIPLRQTLQWMLAAS